MSRDPRRLHAEPRPRVHPQAPHRSPPLSLRTVDRSLALLAVAIRTQSEAALTAAHTARRRASLSPKARAALKLQGQYMGYMRQLRPRQKAMVRAAKAKSGTKDVVINKGYI